MAFPLSERDQDQDRNKDSKENPWFQNLDPELHVAKGWDMGVSPRSGAACGGMTRSHPLLSCMVSNSRTRELVDFEEMRIKISV